MYKAAEPLLLPSPGNGGACSHADRADFLANSPLSGGRSRAGSGVSEYEDRVVVVKKRLNILSCVVNLVLCQLGLGGLTLPQTFALVGWLQASALLVLFALVSSYGMYLLDQTCRALPEHANVASIAGVVAATYGHSGAYALELLMALLSFGCMVSYAGTIGVELRAVAVWLFEPLPASWLDGALSTVNHTVLTALAVIFPLALLPESATQGKIGATATGCMLFVMVVIASAAPWVPSWPPIEFCAGAAEPAGSDEPVTWISTAAGLLKATPMFIFSYNGPTGFLPIRAQLMPPVSDPSRGVGRRKVIAVICLGQAVVLVNYAFTSFMGYWTFCAATPMNVLDGYPASRLLPLAARAALAVQLTCVCAAVWLPLNRAAVWALLRGLHIQMGPGARGVLTFVCLALPVAVSALLGGSLALPLGLTSSVCLTMFMFVLPGLVAFRMRALGTSVVQRAIPLAFAILGVFVAVISTANLLINS